MKIVIMIFLSGILAGCVSNPLSSTTEYNKPLSEYKKVAIVPFNADNTFLLEKKYRDLPKAIAVQTTQDLKDNLSAISLFNNAAIAENCSDHAFKIEGKIRSFIHHKGKYEVIVRGRISDCTTGEPLYLFEVEEKESDLAVLSNNIASRLSDGIFLKLNPND